MTEPERPDRGPVFHTTIHGGQQAIGSDNARFVQYNDGAGPPAEQFRQALEEIRRRLDELPDPGPARAQVAVVDEEFRHRRPDRARVLAALENLRALVVAGTALAEAVRKAASLAARFWPF